MDKKTVHALEHGLPVCEFTREIPAKWPEGQFFVSKENEEEINCPACKEKIAKQKMEENRPRRCRY